MKVVVAGGTGWLGRNLCQSLVSDGHEVVLLSRSEMPRTAAGVNPAPPPVLGGAIDGGPSTGVRSVVWDGRTVGDWASEIEAADAVVNLAGAPIAPWPWTTKRKLVLRSSRLEPTGALVTALGQATHRPPVLINTSAVGFYGDRGDEVVNETDPPGGDFLARLCAGWEAAASPAAAQGVRVVLPRLGVVIGSGGGALRYLALPFRFFLGGHMGSGRQWMSWVHIDDVVGAYRFALEHEAASGAMNVTAPQPVTNNELSRALGRVMGRPSWAPVPGWAMSLALGELAITLLAGQRATPAALQDLGYVFREPELNRALQGALH